MKNESLNTTNDTTLKNSIFKIGKVFSVEGLVVKIKVDKQKNSSHLLYRGDLLKNVSAGSYIKIVKGFIAIIAKVNGEYIKEEKHYNQEYNKEEDKIDRILIVQLLGFIENGIFEKGIKELPLIDNLCFLLDKEEFSIVHNFVKEKDYPIKIGTLALEKGQDIKIGVNSLFASHIGIFGNTGSGKSYTLAHLYRKLFLEFQSKSNFKKNAKFFLLDFNGEYISNNYGKDIIIDEINKDIYELTTELESSKKFPISSKNLNDSSFWSIVLDATEKTQKPFLKRAIEDNFFKNKGYKDIFKDLFHDLIIKEDKDLGLKAITNLISDVYDYIEDKPTVMDLKSVIVDNIGTYANGNFYLKKHENTEKHDKNKMLEIIDGKIENLTFRKINGIELISLTIILKYHFEIINGHSNVEHLSPLIKRLDKRITTLKKIITINDKKLFSEDSLNFVIVSLKDVTDIEIRKMLPLLMCKQLYDEKKGKRENNTYLNIIIDEAHNILSYNSERESESWKDYRLETFEEIIKEGRKFGVFLTIASQRPSDISATILSQLHNYFIHRLINEKDLESVGRTISYLDKVSQDALSILPTGACVFAGLSAHIPVIIQIDEFTEKKHEPDNKTIDLLKNWKDDQSVEESEWM